MKILITGGNGYIAKSIVNSLWDKYHILSPGRNELDLTDIKSVNKFFKNKYFDVVIHTATKGGNRLKEDDQSVLLDNIIMMGNLIQHEDKFSKLINLGSGAEKYAPETPYGKSKKWCKNVVNKNDNWHTLRIYGVFDENELDSRFIKSNIKRYINGEPMIIHQDKIMDFIYMKDLVTIIENIILGKTISKDIDCVYYHAVSLSYIASLINGLSNYKVPINYGDEGSTRAYVGFPSFLNMKCIGLEQGIINTYNKLK